MGYGSGDGVSRRDIVLIVDHYLNEVSGVDKIGCRFCWLLLCPLSYFISESPVTVQTYIPQDH